MKPILIGSKAFKEHITNFRDNKDLDFVFPTKEDSLKYIKTFKPLKNNIGNPECLISSEVYELLKPFTEDKGYYLLPPLSALLSLKLSHLNHDLKNKSWMKHFKDVLWSFDNGYKDYDTSLLKDLYKFWNKYHNDKSHIKLNKKADKFFQASFNQTHDELHEKFKLGYRPAYKAILKDDCDVMVDKDKFFALSDYDKAKTVLEESMVIAFERQFNIRSGFKHVLTNLSKGWWNFYIIENLIPLFKELEKTEPFFNKISKDLRR